MTQTLFVSDLHLDATRPAPVADFVKFLAGPCARARAVYILGDLFDVWIGDDDPAEGLDDVLDALRVRTEAGVPIYIVHGNRDFLLGANFAQRTGTQLLPPRSVIDLHGTPTLIEHGDLLCTDDRAYQRYRRVLRHPLTLRLLTRLPQRSRLRLAHKLRAASARALEKKTMQIMDVNEAEVQRVMRATGVRRLIHGHTHRPAMHKFTLDGAQATRAVLGDWYEQGSYLVADASGITAARP